MSLLTEDIKAELASMVTLCDDGEAVSLEVADIPKPLGEIVAAIAKGDASVSKVYGDEALADPELVYDGASLKDSLKKYGMDSITDEVSSPQQMLVAGDSRVSPEFPPDPEDDSVSNRTPIAVRNRMMKSLSPALSMAQMMEMMNTQKAIAERNSTNAKPEPLTKADVRKKSRNKMAKKSRSANRR